jgi:N-acetylglucosaminyldiphosphoundecaprenol N-acetyl-beta-D-mannosaminyltransferase
LPNLKIAGTWPGRLGGKSGAELTKSLSSQSLEKELVDDLRAKKPDIILVAMGYPLQELLIDKLAPQLKQGFLIGEGGTFDYDSFGGKLAKAPGFVQKIGLEWLWRLMLEPKRLRRQLSVPKIMFSTYFYGRNLDK